MKKNKLISYYSYLFIFLVAVDRFIKYRALTDFVEPVKINDFISFELIFNRGVTAGLFYFNSSVLFALLTILIACITCAVAYNGYTQMKKNKLILGQIAIVAGSLSNLLDRVIYGGVIDMIALSYKEYYFPVFNCADMFIVGGVFIMFLQLLQEK